MELEDVSKRPADEDEDIVAHTVCITCTAKLCSHLPVWRVSIVHLMVSWIVSMLKFWMSLCATFLRNKYSSQQATSFAAFFHLSYHVHMYTVHVTIITYSSGSTSGSSKGNECNTSSSNNRQSASNSGQQQSNNNNVSTNAVGGSNGGGDDEKENDDKHNKKYCGDDHDPISESKEDEDDDETDDETDEEVHTVPCLNANAQTFVPASFMLTTVDEKDENEVWESSSMPTRCIGTVQISKNMTTQIIPSAVKENISNLFYFMDKSMAFRENKKEIDNGKLIVINFGFHDKLTSEILYCVIRKNEMTKSKYRWAMMDRLFSEEQIFDEFELNISPNQLPKSKIFDAKIGQTNKIKNILKTQSMKRIFGKVQWHKIPIHSTVNNKHRKILYLTKKEFINRVTKCNKFNNRVNVIPIMNRQHCVEHVYIVEIDYNVQIGVSIKLKLPKSSLQVIGIHLNKQFILNQHQLASPHHECHCLDDFVSDIDDIKIGNVDLEKNKIKDLQKRNEGLKTENKKLRQLYDKLMQKYLRFKQLLQRILSQTSMSSQLRTDIKFALGTGDDKPDNRMSGTHHVPPVQYVYVPVSILSMPSLPTPQYSNLRTSQSVSSVPASSSPSYGLHYPMQSNRPDSAMTIFTTDMSANDSK